MPIDHAPAEPSRAPARRRSLIHITVDGRPTNGADMVQNTLNCIAHRVGADTFCCVFDNNLQNFKHYLLSMRYNYYKPPRRFALCRLDAHGPIVVGNVGDNSISSYRQHASETQQLADAAPMLSVWSC